MFVFVYLLLKFTNKKMFVGVRKEKKQIIIYFILIHAFCFFEREKYF